MNGQDMLFFPFSLFSVFCSTESFVWAVRPFLRSYFFLGS